MVIIKFIQDVYTYDGENKFYVVRNCTSRVVLSRSENYNYMSQIFFIDWVRRPYYMRDVYVTHIIISATLQYQFKFSTILFMYCIFNINNFVSCGKLKRLET